MGIWQDGSAIYDVERFPVRHPSELMPQIKDDDVQ